MRINEIFYSLQGEGAYVGTPCVFIRFAGCNLNCHFCDTEFNMFREMSAGEIIEEIRKYPANHVILTGGEPTLQLTISLLDKLHDEGKKIHIETNGTQAIDKEMARKIDWITCSPKFEFNPDAQLKLNFMNELKVVYMGQDMSVYDDLLNISDCLFYLQPCDTGDAVRNEEIIDNAIQYIKAHPMWRLSLQIHKLLNIQ